MNALISLLIGSSWKSSVSGLLLGLAVAGAAYAESRTEPVWYVAALGFAWLGRMAKDWNVSNSPVPGPAAPVAPPRE
jgi:hypothetical protein